MIYQDYTLGNITLRYVREEETGRISMFLLPKGVENVHKQEDEVGFLCHLALRHHNQGSSAGTTLKYGQSAKELKYKNQDKFENKNEIRIVTLLEAEEGYQVEHTVCWTKGEAGIEVQNTFRNKTGRKVTLDMLTSFSLDHLSPLQEDDGAYHLKLHRFMGGWSLEGKHREDTIENLGLESSWAKSCFPESERYGVLGSFPVGRWFPFGCLEDTEHHVFWAAQIESNSSWQMELSRDGENYSLSGGIADSEFGGWWKDIAPGESFTAPKAYLSVSDQDFWHVCQNITDLFQKNVNRQPEVDQSLPLIFNEWCTTWGHPTHDKMITLAKKLQEIPVEYVVIDAGWSYQRIPENSQYSNGDWECDMQKFPQGLKALSREMKDMGFRLGIWMEFEVTTNGAKVHESSFDSMHLYRNGEIIQTGDFRRYWDFRQPEVIAYLKEKVIDFLKENEIYYLKVDYNGSIGSGCDGAESLGEGLREQMQAVYEFFKQMRSEYPELVIENCASGGHRLEPMMMGVTAMSSFSDAHACKEIPYLAADLHPLILPRQSQIWAVLLPAYSVKKIQYRLVSGMLGRLCLSGEVADLNDEQWAEVKKAAAFYEKVKGIIKNGRSVLFRDSSDNRHKLYGAQALVRSSENEAMIVYHSFENPPKKICGELPDGNWKIAAHTGAEYEIKIEGNQFEIYPQDAWEAFALYLIPSDDSLRRK